jgi:hypothetical protein
LVREPFLYRSVSDGRLGALESGNTSVPTKKLESSNGLDMGMPENARQIGSTKSACGIISETREWPTAAIGADFAFWRVCATKKKNNKKKSSQPYSPTDPSKQNKNIEQKTEETKNAPYAVPTYCHATASTSTSTVTSTSAFTASEVDR